MGIGFRSLQKRADLLSILSLVLFFLSQHLCVDRTRKPRISQNRFLGVVEMHTQSLLWRNILGRGKKNDSSKNEREKDG